MLWMWMWMFGTDGWVGWCVGVVWGDGVGGCVKGGREWGEMVVV